MEGYVGPDSVNNVMFAMKEGSQRSKTIPL